MKPFPNTKRVQVEVRIESSMKKLIPILRAKWIEFRGYRLNPAVGGKDQEKCYLCKRIVGYDDALSCNKSKCPVSPIPF